MQNYIMGLSRKKYVSPNIQKTRNEENTGKETTSPYSQSQIQVDKKSTLW